MAADPSPMQFSNALRAVRDVLRDRRYVMFLLAAFFNTMVYMQYLSTLPLDIEKQGVALLWYTVAVALEGKQGGEFLLPADTEFGKT